jgi:hypothetical protein
VYTLHNSLQLSLSGLSQQQLSLPGLSQSHNWRLTLLSLLPGPGTSCRPTSQSPKRRLRLLCPWPPSQGPEPPFSDRLTLLWRLNTQPSIGWHLGYTAWEQTTEKTLPRNRPQRNTHCCVSSRYQGMRSSFVDPSGLQHACHNIFRCLKLSLHDSKCFNPAVYLTALFWRIKILLVSALALCPHTTIPYDRKG